MKKNPVYLLCFIALFWGAACHRPSVKDIAREIDSISKQLVPDKREGFCEVKIYQAGQIMILKGETNLPEAGEVFHEFMEKRNMKMIDSLTLLPDTSIIKKSWGVVNVSVCNIRSTPTHDAELVSQALMGNPVRILKKDEGWYLVQTPDSYLGWVDSEAVVSLCADDFMKWKSSQRIIYLKKTGDIYSDPDEGKVVSDIVAGCIVLYKSEKKDCYNILLADGRNGFIDKKDCAFFADWALKTRPEARNLISTAEKFTGTPYLWGGTSPKGMDCSGFVKTVYFLNGIILARDVSLQFKHGLSINVSENTDSLRAGDLLFFGWNRNDKPMATHVGMYIGDSEFIHASGMIQINSLDSTRSNFSSYRKNMFLGARRITANAYGKGVQLISEHPWYK